MQYKNPFDYKPVPDQMYCYKKPTIKILVNDKRDYYQHTNSALSIGIKYNLFNLFKIKESDLIITDLLLGMNNKSRFIVQEIKCLDPKYPVLCYLDFPFNNKVSVEIYPLIQKYLLTDEFSNLDKNDFKDGLIYTSGYICWVIAQVYATIFKSYADKADIHSCCFRDLYIDMISIHKNNLIKISIIDENGN